MADTKADMTARLAALTHDFALALPERLTTLTRLWEAAAAGNREALDEARRTVHKLAGSAGTFGFTDIGRASAAVESALDAAAGRPLDATDIAHISGLIATLKHLPAAEAAAKTPAAAPETAAAAPASPPSAPIGMAIDDRAYAGELAALLEDIGHRVVQAGDLTELTEEARGEKLGVVLLDLTDKSGAYLRAGSMRAVRGAFGTDTPMVFFAPRGDAKARLAAAQAGGAAFATPETSAAILARRIVRLVRRGKEAPLRVMIVEDDDPTARYYEIALNAAGLATHVAHTPIAALDGLAAFDPETILMDLYLPGASGLVVAEALRQHEAWRGAPVLFLSTETSVSVHMTARSVAADDFLVKPIDGAALAAAVRTRAARYRDLIRGLGGI